MNSVSGGFKHQTLPDGRKIFYCLFGDKLNVFQQLSYTERIVHSPVSFHRILAVGSEEEPSACTVDENGELRRLPGR